MTTLGIFVGGYLVGVISTFLAMLLGLWIKDNTRDW